MSIAVIMCSKGRDIDVGIKLDDESDLISIGGASGSEKTAQKNEFDGSRFEATSALVKSKKTNHKYIQKNNFKAITRCFTIFNNFYLHRTIESFRNKDNKKTQINLTYVNPEPTLQKHSARIWLVASVVACVLGVAYIYVCEFSGMDYAQPYMLPAGIIAITAGILLAYVFYYRRQDMIVYHSLVGQAPLIELFHTPNQSDFKTFTNLLNLHIKQAQAWEGVSMMQRLKAELSCLRRLSEEGEITTKAYEQARALILKHKDFK